MQYEELFGIKYALTNYHEACLLIIKKAKEENKKEGFGVSALAVHGLIEGYKNPGLRTQINNIDLVVADGQPIKWALNYFHNAGLDERVYGPTLMLKVLQQADLNCIPIFLYGSTESTLEKLSAFIKQKYPMAAIAGIQADRFRESTDEEKALDRKKIVESGAKIVFVGRGCPRQEKWVAENKEFLPVVMIAVGAAFDFHAGNVRQAPGWMQDRGLEWLYRLMKEPGRLWKRYLITNSHFVLLFLVNAFKQIFKR
jgi:N-acetylglucosaminyldiphosphoundecaprenol N-acetyl-beta-D-mannosaminyltransferase